MVVYIFNQFPWTIRAHYAELFYSTITLNISASLKYNIILMEKENLFVYVLFR